MNEFDSSDALVPPSEDVDDRVARIAQQAEAFRDSAIYQNVMTQMREAAMAAFRGASVGDVTLIMHAKRMLRVIDDFDALVVNLRDSGLLQKQSAEYKDEGFKDHE